MASRSPRAALARLRLAGPTALAAVALASCGAAPPPPRPRSLPDEASDRDLAVDELGRRAWDALAAGDPFTLLADEEQLSDLVSPAIVARIEERRPGFRARLGDMVHAMPERLAGASYLGVCAQSAHEEGPGGALQLTERTWVIGRVLVVGRIEGTGRRIASWIDGPFAFDGERFVAVELENLEEPRWEHSDLELGVCDLSEGL